MTLSAHKVPALQPGHLHQPASDRRVGRAGRGKSRSLPTVPLPTNGEISLGKKRSYRLYDMGRLQLRGRSSSQREVLYATTFTPRSILRNTSTRREIPSSDRRKSQEISRTSARTRLRTLTHDGIIRIGAEVARRRYPCGQGHPQGRDGAYRRGAPAPRDIRRKGKRGQGYLPARSPRRIAVSIVDVKVFYKRKLRRTCLPE